MIYTLPSTRLVTITANIIADHVANVGAGATLIAYGSKAELWADLPFCSLYGIAEHLHSRLGPNPTGLLTRELNIQWFGQNYFVPKNTISVGASLSWTGLISYSFRTQLKAQVLNLDPSQAQTISGTQFPRIPIVNSGVITGYGGAHADWLPGKRVRFFEEIILGTTATLTYSFANQTVTDSLIMTVPYELYYESGVIVSALTGTRLDLIPPPPHASITSSLNFRFTNSIELETLPSWSDSDMGVTISVAPRHLQVNCGTTHFPNTRSGKVYGYSDRYRRYSFTSQYNNQDDSPASLPIHILSKSNATSLTSAPSHTHEIVQFGRHVKSSIGAIENPPWGPDPFPYFNSVGFVGAAINTTGYTGDARDFRLQILGQRWHVGDISFSFPIVDSCTSLNNWSAINAVQSVVSSGIALTASANASWMRTFIPDFSAESFRFLKIKIRSIGSANNTLTASIAGHNWIFTTGNDGSVVERVLDLCCSTSETSEVESKDSRFPMVNPGGFPIGIRVTDQYKMGWGVQFLDLITFTGFVNGVTYELQEIKSHSHDGQNFWSCYNPFSKSLLAWNSPSDITFIYPYIWNYSDGKPVDWPYMGFVDPIGSAPDYFRYYSISEMMSFFISQRGYTFTPNTTVVDEYHNSNLESCLLMGGGKEYRYGETISPWSSWIKRPFGRNQSIFAQDQWDLVKAFPTAGISIWTGAELNPSAISTPLACHKIVRGRVEGLVFGTDRQGSNNRYIKAYETTSPTNIIGDDISDTLGRYETEEPFSIGNRDITTELTPVLKNNFMLQNRERGRTSFRIKDEVRIPQVFDAIANHKFYINSYIEDTNLDGRGDVYVRVSFYESVRWEDPIYRVTTTDDVSGVSVCIDDRSFVYVHLARLNNTYYRLSTDYGKTWKGENLVFIGMNFPQMRADKGGNIVFMASDYVSGTSGPRFLYSIQYLSGDLSLGAPVRVRDESGAFVQTADESFTLSNPVNGFWGIALKRFNDSHISYFVSTDFGKTIRRVS